MAKTLIYVDGENVTSEELKGFYEQFDWANNNCVTSKIYGNHANMASKVQIAYALGMEYFDTAFLVHTSKNVADMKIVVDAITDVLAVPENDYPVTVALISHDCDFMPLVYKLVGMGITVNAPFLQRELITDKSVIGSASFSQLKQVDAYLREHGFNIGYNVSVKKSYWELAVKFGNDNLDEDAVDEWATHKQLKLASEYWCAGSDIADRILAMNNRNISFSDIYGLFNNLSRAEIERMFTRYTQIVFGFSYNKVYLSRALVDLCPLEINIIS